MIVYDDNARGAYMAGDACYRYSLWRRWAQQLGAPAGPPLVVDMLNPSTADAERNDQTITRLINYAEALGCGGLIVVNLYAWRATNPAELDARFMERWDIVGPENLVAVEAAYQHARTGLGYVVAAWGATGAPQKRDRVADHIAIATNVGVELRTLLASPTGDPCHPLVRRKVHPVPIAWSPR